VLQAFALQIAFENSIAKINVNFKQKRRRAHLYGNPAAFDPSASPLSKGGIYPAHPFYSSIIFAFLVSSYG
jgi:hypothetical protein